MNIESIESIERAVVREIRTFRREQKMRTNNKAVHGIDFYTAAYVFNDEFKL